MTPFVTVNQEKGGVFKTFISINLTAFLNAAGHNFRPVDFDRTAGLLTQVFPIPASANIMPDPDKIRSGESLLPKLMERVMEGDRYVVDCGSNTGPGWEALLTEVDPSLWDRMEAAGVRTTVIVPITNSEKTHESFELYKRIFPRATQLMVVVRAYDGEQFARPAHPSDLTVDFPLPPPRLFSTYVTLGMTIQAIAQSELAGLRFDRGLATGYLPALTGFFEKITQHIAL
jgi:hypothetical protein